MIGLLDLFRKISALYLQNFSKVVATMLVPLALPAMGLLLPDSFRTRTLTILIMSVFFAVVFFARVWADQTYFRIFFTSSQGEAVGFSALARASIALLPGYAVLVFLWWLVVSFGFVLLLVPGCIFLTWYFFVAPAFLVEGRGILDSFRRSRELTHGLGMAIFGRFFSFILALFFLRMLIGQGIGLLLASAPASGSVFWTAYAVGLIIDQLMVPLFAALTVVLYNEVRRIKTA
ncbi:MAG: hypothetical protein AAB444_01715 [Patescibacteria group bacterium]